MSIPDRLYRLARGKIGEIREMFDNSEADAELDPELLARVERAQARKSAKRELDDAIEGEPPAEGTGRLHVPPPRQSTAAPLPEEIRGAGTRQSSVPAQSQDLLAAHYRLLGVETGSDFATVQAVYEKLASRCQPDRFPPGSPEALEARDIENRLEATYKVLREALDPTARRFDMLEI